ncbi:MAG: hypothetical protein AB2L14_04360 [Candidatus Xenobiia bacterium LiM19]
MLSGRAYRVLGLMARDVADADEKEAFLPADFKGPLECFNRRHLDIRQVKVLPLIPVIITTFKLFIIVFHNLTQG